MKKILIIEDNQQNMYLMDFLLKQNGYEVLQAWNGTEGIAMAIEMKPSLILLDIQLPGMDGYSVAKELKNTPDVADIPIVAVTSYAMAGDRERTIKAGCTGYFEKPIKPETFVEEIKKFL